MSRGFEKRLEKKIGENLAVVQERGQ